LTGLADLLINSHEPGKTVFLLLLLKRSNCL